MSNAERLGLDDGETATPEVGVDEDDEGRGGDTEGRSSDDGHGGSTDDQLDRPDPATLNGVDAVYARLLVDIDESELSMIHFQDRLSEAFEEAGFGSQEELTDEVRAAAEAGQKGLAAVRERLVAPLDDDGAETVRAAYLQHLDSWVNYMAAVEEDPGILGVEDRTRPYILSINVTADGFARTLEDELPDDVDGEVQVFADEILERGFRGFGESNV
jgi:hypothetical protein